MGFLEYMLFMAANIIIFSLSIVSSISHVGSYITNEGRGRGGHPRVIPSVRAKVLTQAL